MKNSTHHFALIPLSTAIVFAVMLAAQPTGLRAAPGGAPDTKTPSLTATGARVENYLNTITSMRARFLQVAPSGQISRGEVWLSRPGKLRIEYDPPVPVLILTEGHWLMYYDKELEQPTYAPLDETPAGLLVREKIQLADKELSHEIFQRKGVIRVAITRRESPESGKLTLVLSEKPLRLRQWTITDGRGDETRVALENPVFNAKIDAKAFDFTPPERDGDSE
jgi:outer membrane lipoprotein-sorting protein